MSTKWYKHAKTPRLWKARAKETLQGMPDNLDEVLDVASGDISEASQLPEVGDTSGVGGVADMGQEIKRGEPNLLQQHPENTDNSDNSDQYSLSGGEKHKHPLMLFVGDFNEITTIAQEDEYFDIDIVDELIAFGEEVLDELTDDNQVSNLAESLDCIYELRESLLDSDPFDDQYMSWFYAYNFLKRTGTQFSKHTSDVEPPDEIFDFEDELIPAEAKENIEEKEGKQEQIDEFFGISETPDLDDSPQKYTGTTEEDNMEDDYYVDEFLVPQVDDSHIPDRHVTSSMMKQWQARKSGSAVKHNLSLRQLLKAYDKAFDKMVGVGGVWILASTLFSGLSRWEIQALREEGLIRVQGGKMQLTRLGYDPRGTIFDR